MASEKLNNFLNSLASRNEKIFEIYCPESEQLVPTTGHEFSEIIVRWASIVSKIPDTVVPIFGNMDKEMLGAYWGCIIAGKIPTFISYPSIKISPEDYQHKLNNYRNQFENNYFIGLNQEPNQLLNVITPDKLMDVSIEIKSNLLDEDILFLQCSSGTTGMQKAVQIKAGQLCSQIKSYAKEIDLSQNDKIVSWLPLYHDMGLITTFFMPLLMNVPVIYIDPFYWSKNPSILLKIIEKECATFTWLPNFAYSLLSRCQGKYNLNSMKSFINCSEPVTEKAIKLFCNSHSVRLSQISVCYALAENVFAVSQSAIGKDPELLNADSAELQNNVVKLNNSGNSRSLISCGRIIDGTEVKIESQSGQDVGEIFIRGECTVPGYFKQTASNQNGWLATGDMGFIRDNNLYVTGRKKELIISHGKNIYPHDIDEIVNSFPEIHKGRVVSIGYIDALESEQILILFELIDDLPVSEKEKIADKVKIKVDALFEISCQAAAVPKKWLRKTSSGKIARSANLEKYLKFKDQKIYVVGDSHVRTLWTEDRSYIDVLDCIRSKWLGVFWSGEIEKFHGQILSVIENMKEADILLFMCGEPECRVIFPGSDDPQTRIQQSVAAYEKYFCTLRDQHHIRVGYISGPPTNAKHICENKIDPATPLEEIWEPPLGTPELRYKLQDEFYSAMKQMCENNAIPYIDGYSPFLTNGSYIDDKQLRDGTHVLQKYNINYFEWIDSKIGFVSSQRSSTEKVTEIWDGTYKHFEQILKREIQRISKFTGEIDYEQILSTGAIDSLAFIELVVVLETVLNINIDLNKDIKRAHFESISSIYDYFVGKSPKTLIIESKNLFKDGAYANSISCIEAALKIAPDNIHAWIQAGIVLIETGNRQQATECLEVALTLDSDNNEVISLLQSLNTQR